MKLLFNDEIPDRHRKKPYRAKQKVVVDKPYVGDLSDIAHIKDTIHVALFRNPDHDIRVKEVIKPSDYHTGVRPLSYRVTVHSRSTRRAIYSFWVEKLQDGYVFSPPLNIKDIENASRSKFDSQERLNPSGVSLRK